MADISAAVKGWLDSISQEPSRFSNLFSGFSNNFEVIDPGSGKTLVTLPESDSAAIQKCIARARENFDSGVWRLAPPDNRERKLFKLAELVERDHEFLTELEALDTGKPLAEAEFDIQEVVTVLRYYAGWSNKVSGQTISTPANIAASTVRSPVGVCVAITPWNYPLPILMYKLAPALAFGNTFIAKPSELAPLSCLYFSQLCTEAGIPDGVIGVVLGGASVGAELTQDSGIDKIAFTGSTKTGQSIMQAAAKTTTRVSLELGGKSPQVVFESADLDAAAEGIALGIWTNAGQICVAGSRLIVQKNVASELISKLKDIASKYVLGHALNPKTLMGPLISEASRGRVEKTIDDARLAGGSVTQLGTVDADTGFFVLPTIVENLPSEHPIHQEEIFGPVISVLTFESEAEAIELANSTRYGLAAGIWTGISGQGHRVARAITSGSVWINTYGTFHPTLPFGGTKSSGFGRELGESAIEGYTDIKTIVEEISG